MQLPIDANVFPQRNGVFVVGGSIRDLLCGRMPVDYDLAVSDDPGGFARSLAARSAGSVVEIGQHGHRVLRVVARDYFFDVMPINGATIEEDLQRRDFTINAMALELSTGELIDPTGGRRDLAAKKVRLVAPDAFRQDPVRLIRAYRMAASFDYAIDPGTEAAIARDADLIRRSAGERIREEFFKILESARFHAQLLRMAHSGLLFSIFPPLLRLKNCRLRTGQPAKFWQQTLDACGHLETLLNCRDLSPAQSAERLYKDLDTARATLLKWAVLLQDIGRPAAAGATAHFYGHAAKSAAMARGICRELRFSRRQSDVIEWIIRHHLKPFYLFDVRQRGVSVDRAFIRFFMKCGHYTPDILLHALAGFRGRRAAQDPAVDSFAEFVGACIDNYYSILQPRASRPPPLNGDDLIKAFGLKPSAAFKRILKTVAEEHLARQNLTRAQALALVAKLLGKEQN
jgi:tRNA nucleotidyltransferase/poly(A) polymerase